MAINPPEKNDTARKGCYVVAFFVFSLLLIAVNITQAERNNAQQEHTKADAAKNQQALQTQYDTIQGRLQAINEVVSNPAPGVDAKQIVAAVLTISAKAQAKNKNDLRARASDEAQALLNLIVKYSCNRVYLEQDRTPYNECMRKMRDEFIENTDIYGRKILAILDDFKSIGIYSDLVRGDTKSAWVEQTYGGLMILIAELPKDD